MPLPRPTYRSKLFRDFQAISAGSPHSRIRFFESHEGEIRRLEEEECNALVFAYAEALFQAGVYAKYKVVADEIIACCLEPDSEEPGGEDLFQKTILRKAVACYYLMEYEQAVHLFKELLRINPANEAAKKGLRRTFYRIKPGPVLNARAVSVLLLMVAALITAFELLYARHFHPSWVAVTEALRIGFFAMGVAVLLVSDLWQRRLAARKAADFCEEVEERGK
ncbi:MAG: hypothetical protein WA004_08035 [Saprospiraceae bacterium]